MTKIDSVRQELKTKELSKIIKQIRNHGLSKVISSGYVEAVKVNDLLEQQSIMTTNFMKQKPIEELHVGLKSKFTIQKNVSRVTQTTR